MAEAQPHVAQPQPELRDLTKMPMTKVIVHAPAGVHTGITEKCWAKVNEYIQLIPYEIETDVPEDMVTMLENAWVNVERIAAQPKTQPTQASPTHVPPTQTSTVKASQTQPQAEERHEAEHAKKN